jgi:carbonic anhydrase/acetyltransferase-like protein (isoleucine patch superfamily)
MELSIGGHEPQTHDALFVAPNASVIGNVRLGAESSVWYSSVLRGDSSSIRVGARSNLQDGVVVHADPDFPATIGDGVSVGHRAVVHGCTIGDDCLIGMGAVVLNGASVGAGSLVAAGSVVPEGAQIPPRSLVAGVPATVKRELSDEQVARLRVNADHYVELAATHAATHAAAKPV